MFFSKYKKYHIFRLKSDIFTDVTKCVNAGRQERKIDRKKERKNQSDECVDDRCRCDWEVCVYKH